MSEQVPRQLHVVAVGGFVQGREPALLLRVDGCASLDDQAHDLDATFELRVRDPRGAEPDRFELRVLEGRCQVRSGAARDPGAVATLGADDMIRLASGAVGWPALLANGRLELSGDPFLALRFPMLFRLPAAAVSG